MTPNNHEKVYPFSYDDAPSRCIVEAVAWTKGVEPNTLDPLYDVIDLDALNELTQSDKKAEPTITFTYEGCEVQVDSKDTVIVRESLPSIHDQLDETSNLLVLEAGSDQLNDRLCADLLTVEPYDDENVLSVTSPLTNVWPTSWNTHAGKTPTKVELIAVGDFTRSTSTSRGSELPSEQIQVTSVSDPENLSELGVRISECLSNWEHDDNQILVCFRPLSTLLQYADTLSVFRFLHILTGRIKSADAFAHYHLNLDAHDEGTVKTLKPLFDTVIEVDETGDWEVPSQ